MQDPVARHIPFCFLSWLGQGPGAVHRPERAAAVQGHHAEPGADPGGLLRNPAVRHAAERHGPGAAAGKLHQHRRFQEGSQGEKTRFGV